MSLILFASLHIFNGWTRRFLICDLLPLLVETNNPQLSQLRHHCTRVATGTTCSLRFPAFCFFCFRIFVSCYVIVVSTVTKIWSIQSGTGQFGSSCKLLPLRVTIILLRCSKELREMTELSQGSCYPRLLQQQFSLQQEGAADPGFFPSQSSSSEQQDHHSAELVFLLCFFTDWAFFISVKKMLIILCTKWFLLRVTTCNGCSARRLWSFFDLNLGKSWHVIHSYGFFIPGNVEHFRQCSTRCPKCKMHQHATSKCG